MKRKIISTLFALVLVLTLGLVTAVPVAAATPTTIASSTMVFEGALADNGDGTYSGTIPVVTGGGFDVYARDGADAVFFTELPATRYDVTIAKHDAWPAFDPDTPDWEYYALTLEGNTWKLVYNENDPKDWVDCGGVPMSGIMDWLSMYASETDLGFCFGDPLNVPALPGDANYDWAATHGGGAACWDMDWVLPWGSEVIPLAFPGFAVEVTDLTGGNYRVTLTPAAGDNPPGPVINEDTGESYGAIQPAIDAPETLDTHTIIVAAGTYNEQVVVNKANLTLLGARANVDPTAEGARTDPLQESIISGSGLTLSGSDGIVKIVNDSVTFDGFTIKGYESEVSGFEDRMGIYLIDSSDCNICCNIISDIDYEGGYAVGIGLYGDSSMNTFTSNRISDIGKTYDIDGWSPGNGRSFGAYGIYLTGVSSDNDFANTEISDLVASSVANGIRFDGVLMTGNTFTDTAIKNIGKGLGITGSIWAVGIELWGACENTFTNTIITNVMMQYMTYGIGITEDSTDNTFVNTHVSDIITTTNENRARGISIFGDRTTFSGGEISGIVCSVQNRGFYVSANDVSITGFDITGASVGIYLTADASGNIINYNNIHDNSEYGVRNEATEKVDATMNWWGNISGPNFGAYEGEDPQRYYPWGNPGGTGDNVTGTGRVNCVPWLTRNFETVLAENIAYFGFPMVHLGKGWNTLSTPVALDPAANTWGSYKKLGDGLALYAPFPEYINAYRYINDGEKQGFGEVTELTPCDAIYIHMAEPDIAPVLYSPDMSVPSKELYAGWNLVGLADWEHRGDVGWGPWKKENVNLGTAANVALTTVFMVTGDRTGYSLVVSPPMNQNPWSFVREGTVRSDVAGEVHYYHQYDHMFPTKGYWVFMENGPDTLAGFTFTPMSLD